MRKTHGAVVIGTSLGGLEALSQILPELPKGYAMPVLIVQHVRESVGSYMAEHLSHLCRLTVKEAEDREPLSPGVIYIAPAGYHLLVDPSRECSLSLDTPVHHSRPSIDVLFESAADAYGSMLIGVLLTGANADGACGLKKIQSCGGTTIVQKPSTAKGPQMPQAALDLMTPDIIGDLDSISAVLARA